MGNCGSNGQPATTNGHRPAVKKSAGGTKPTTAQGQAKPAAKPAAPIVTSATKTPTFPQRKNVLLIVDPQIDFHPGGSLAVAGSDEDSGRIAEMVHSNIKDIDHIFVTLDSHHRNHIAHGIFWENDEGESPNPFTLITNQNIKDKMWRPRNKALLDHALKYTAALEAQGKFMLSIWPEHCLIGTQGHAVYPPLNEALQKWAGETGKSVTYIMKGQNCLTEMYSAIKADYELPDDVSTQRDPLLQAELQATDRLLVCGQALSHCVNFTFCDVLETWPKDQTHRLVLIRDGCSSVGGFESAGEEFVQKITSAGCQIMHVADVFPDTDTPSRGVVNGEKAEMKSDTQIAVPTS